LGIVASNYITETPVAENAIDVFQALILLVGALSGVTVWDKQNLYKEKSE
jgi:hypothetical protein